MSSGVGLFILDACAPNSCSCNCIVISGFAPVMLYSIGFSLLFTKCFE